MFFFGHIGIGKRLVNLLTREIPSTALIVGTLLPDLIDKPLYYSLYFLTGKHGKELGLISGSRTFGHTAIFVLLLTLGSCWRKSRFLLALSIGAATHLIVDSLGDCFGEALGIPLHSGASTFLDGTRSALLWPFTGWDFPYMPFATLSEHLSTFDRPWIFWGEIIGLCLLVSDYLHGEFKYGPAKNNSNSSQSQAGEIL